ncbi:MAG: GntR family transcriptional regulator [Eubacterium sp.]|nr:GntR family transcriptional regulator [Eubacterium sp.]
MIEDKLGKMMTEYQDMPLRDVVFHTLRKGILRGDLKPDERLMEIKLADRLGVSRTPIREAIRMLQLEGLVINIPRKGAHVAKITEKDLKDVLEVRAGLEDLSVRLACERITEQQEEKLRAAAEHFAGAALAEEEQLIDLAEADEAFHAVIYDATCNDRLVQMLNNIKDQMYRYRVEYLKDSASHELLVEEHRQLCDSLAKRDADAAAKVMHLHIQRQEEYILKTLSSN